MRLKIRLMLVVSSDVLKLSWYEVIICGVVVVV